MDGKPMDGQSSPPKRQRGKSRTAEDHALIKYLYDTHGWVAPRIARENPTKGWTKIGIKKILQKVKKGQSPARKPGGGPEVKVRAARNVEKVKTELELKEGLSAGGASARQLAALAGLGKTSVRDILTKDLMQHSLAQVPAQILSDQNRQKRMEFCAQMLAEIEAGALDVDMIVFTDETTLR